MPGALNVKLDQKTKDLLVRMRVEDDGPDLHRRRTMEDVTNLAINYQIQEILPPKTIIIILNFCSYSSSTYPEKKERSSN